MLRYQVKDLLKEDPKTFRARVEAFLDLQDSEMEGFLDPAVTHSRQNILFYEGPRVTHNGRAEDLNRTGWNWFSPSPTTLSQMMTDVGFTNIRLSQVIQSSAGKRILAVGQKDRHRDMMRSGLSVRRTR